MIIQKFERFIVGPRAGTAGGGRWQQHEVAIIAADQTPTLKREPPAGGPGVFKSGDPKSCATPDRAMNLPAALAAAGFHCCRTPDPGAVRRVIWP
jgi:hypothetical protein